MSIRSSWIWGSALLPVLAVAAPQAELPSGGNLPAPVVPAPLRTLDPSILPPAKADAQGLDHGDKVQAGIKQIRFKGAVSLPESELQALVSDALGRNLDFNQLQELTQRVSRHYRERGFLLARALLPEQTITDGVLLIEVQEGRLGAVRLSAAAPLQDAALSPFLAGIRPGEPLRTEPLEHGLLLLSDLPGLRVRSVLQEGRDAGTTDLEVQVERERPVNALVMLDNHGNRYSGEWRLTGHASLPSLIHSGDSLDLTATYGYTGYRYGRAAWQTPVGGDGLRLGVLGSLMHYRLGKEFESLDAHGNAADLGVFGSYPLARTRTQQTLAQAALDLKRYGDTANGAESTKHVQVLQAGVADRRQYASGAAALGTVALSLGRLDLDAISAAADAVGHRTEGTYAKLAFQAEHERPLYGPVSGALRVAGQFAGSNLDSSEKMSLGGPQGVRAYAVGEGSADDALMASAELRHRWGEAVLGRLFVDVGHGRPWHAPLDGEARSRHLAGAGIGLDLNLPQHGLMLQSALAWRTSGEPGADLDRRPRLWLMLSKSL